MAIIQVFQIDAEARYALITNGLSQREAESLVDILHQWWQSDDPFCIVSFTDNEVFRFERTARPVEDGDKFLVNEDWWVQTEYHQEAELCPTPMAVS